jgi:hypothetical protein
VIREVTAERPEIILLELAEVAAKGRSSSKTSQSDQGTFIMPNRLVFLLKSEFSKMIALRWNKKLFRNDPLQKTIRSITLRVEQNLRNAKCSDDDGLAVGTPRIN